MQLSYTEKKKEKKSPGFIEIPYMNIWNGHRKYGSFFGFIQAPSQGR